MESSRGRHKVQEDQGDVLVSMAPEFYTIVAIEKYIGGI